MDRPLVNPNTAKIHRFSIWLRQSFWIGFAPIMFIMVEVGLQIGMPIYRQHVAIREIDRLGGVVHTENRGPQWLRSLIGQDWLKPFGNAWRFIVIGIGQEDDADAMLRHAASLSKLEVIRLDFTKVTDRGVAQIKDLAELKILQLDYTKITDASLAHLKGMSKLMELGLNDTRVTDTGLKDLKGLTNLKRIWLKKTDVTDAGVEELKRALPGLDVQR